MIRKNHPLYLLPRKPFKEPKKRKILKTGLQDLSAVVHSYSTIRHGFGFKKRKIPAAAQ